MRKLIFPAVLLGAMALLSFTAILGGGITRQGATLYQVAPNARLSEGDKQALLNVLKTVYNVSDLRAAGQMSLKPVALRGKKGANPNWVVSTKAFATFIDTKAIHYDVIKEPRANLGSNFANMDAILTKYADSAIIDTNN